MLKVIGGNISLLPLTGNVLSKISHRVKAIPLSVFFFLFFISVHQFSLGQTASVFMRNSQTQPGATGYVYDFANTQGSSGTVTSTGTTSTTYQERLAFTITSSNLAKIITGNAYSVSINVPMRSSTNAQYRFRLQRVNSAGVVQASTGYSSDIDATGIQTANLSFSNTQTWGSGDRLVLSIEVRSQNNTSNNRTITVNTGDANSWVSYAIPCDPITSYPYTQNFDSWATSNPATACTSNGSVVFEECWTNETSGDNIDWDVLSGPTASSGTGPSSDHSGGGNFIYTESSSGTTGCTNQRGYVTTPVFDFSGLSSPELSFWYNMYGIDMGTLSVQVSIDGGSNWSSDVWILSGDQGTSWTEAVVDLSAFQGQSNLVIRFTGLTGGGYRSDMAIDDITVDGLNCIVPDTPTLSASSLTICSGESTTLSLSGNLNDADHWQWYSGSCGGTPVGQGTSITVSPSSTTTYYVRGEGNSCDGNCNSITVTVNPSPVITSQPASQDICIGDNTTLNIGSSDQDLYRWQTANSAGGPWNYLTSGFNTNTVFFESDFSSAPANTNVYGNASISNGYLELTPVAGSQLGGFVIQSTPGTNYAAFNVNFDYRIWDGSGADGISLSYAPDISNDAGTGEEGEGTGIILKLDTYDNNVGATGSQIRVSYNGTEIWTNSVGAFDLRSTNYRNVNLNVDGTGHLFLTIDGNLIINNLNISGYTAADKSSWKFKFSGRTGGLNDAHRIDNLNIQFGDNDALTVSPTADTYYRAVVAGVSCSVTSNAALISVNPPPTATIDSNNGPVCAGGDAEFTITGTDGATVDYNINGGAASTITLAGGTALVSVPSVSGNQTINLISVSIGTCTQLLSENSTVSIIPTPSATLSGNAVICAGESANLSVAFTGSAPYSFTYSDGTTPVNVSGITNNPYVFSVSPSVSSTYSLTSFSDANCNGTSSGAASIVINDEILYTPGNDTTICQGESASLKVTFDDKSVNFDGNNGRISISNSNEINTSVLDNRTVSFWFKANDVTTRQFMYEEGAQVNGFSVYLEGGYVYVHAWEGNTSWGQVRTTVTTGTWYHVAFVFDANASDGEYFKGYLNGVYFGGNSNPAATNGLSAHSGDINIGMNGGNIRMPDDSQETNPDYFNGNIDEFKLWNRPLDGNELLTERWNVNDGTQSGANLIVYYSFNNDNGSTATDQAGGNDTGSISGGVTYETNTPFTPDISWSPGGMTGQTETVSPVSTTVYTYTLTHPFNGCETTGTITVNVNPSPTASIASSNSICIGDDAVFVISGTSGATLTYNLNGGSNSTVVLTGGTATITVTGATSDQTLNLVSVDDGTCSANLTESATVLVNPLPNVVANASSTDICEGESVTLTGSGATSYIWDNGVTDGVAFTPVTTTTYTVTGTDGNGCENTDQITIVVTPRPTTPSPTNNSPVCDGSTVELYAPTIAGATYSWTGPSGFSSTDQNPTFAANYYSNQGTYSVTITVNGCTSAAGTTDVVIDPASVGGNIAYVAPVCEGSSITLNLSGNTGDVVRWERRLGSSGAWTSVTGTSTSLTDTPPSGGTWEYRAVVQSGTCSEAYSATQTVTVNPTLTIALSSDPIVCQNTTTTSLTYSATTGAPAGWLLTFDSDAVSAGFSSTQTGSLSPAPGAISVNVPYNVAAGTYNATLSVFTYTPSCSSIDYPVAITVNSSSPVFISISGNNTVCDGTSVTYTATATNGGTSPVYQWKVNGSNVGSNSNTYTYSPTDGDKITCELISDADCASGNPATSNEINMTVNPLPTATIDSNNGPVCEGETVQFVVSGTDGAVLTYHINSDASETATLNSGITTIYITNAVSSQTLYLESITDGTCSATLTENTTVTVYPLPTAPTAGNVTTTYDGTTLSATASAGAGETIDWYDAASGGTAASAPSAINVGTYTAWAEARNTTSGCVSASRTEVTLTIHPANLDITANNQSKEYDGAVFSAFTVSYSGFVTGDDETDLGGSLSFSGTATTATDVGIYTITPAGLTSSNYAINFVDGSLEITLRPVTVTADDQSKECGYSDPAFTYQLTAGSLVTGDSFTGNPTRDAGENLGNYNITQGTLSLGTNYSITFIPATFSIVDTEDPTFTCPMATTVVFDASCQVTIPDLISGITDENDNCGTPTLSQSPAAGTILPSGAGTVHQVTITADDGNGNTSSCNVDVTGVPANPIDILVEDLGNSCQSGETGSTTTVTWDITKIAGTATWTFDYEITEGATVVASGNNVAANGNTQVSFDADNETAQSKTFTLSIFNVQDACGTDESNTTNNSDSVTLYGVPATSDIITN